MSTSSREDDVQRSVDDEDANRSSDKSDGDIGPVGDMGEGIEATLPGEDEPGNM